MARLKAENYKMEYVGMCWIELFENLIQRGK